jgi:hypothetical protein
MYVNCRMSGLAGGGHARWGLRIKSNDRSLTISGLSKRSFPDKNGDPCDIAGGLQAAIQPDRSDLIEKRKA